MDQSPSLRCTVAIHQDLKKREVAVVGLKGAGVGLVGAPAAGAWV